MEVCSSVYLVEYDSLLASKLLNIVDNEQLSFISVALPGVGILGILSPSTPVDEVEVLKNTPSSFRTTIAIKLLSHII